MIDPKEKLIEKYLAGDADDVEVQQIQQALADDPEVADALMAEAYMHVHLRETMTGSELGDAITRDELQPDPVVRRIAYGKWIAAALLLAAITGWTVAIYVADKLGEANTDISALKSRVTELENASTKPSHTPGKEGAPEIHSTRGWLMALPENGGFDGETLMIGTTVPLNQRLWTCPWGAAEFKYDSGITISIERNTTVKFNETDDLRRLTLERGIVHVTNLTEIDKRPTEIKCKLATVRLIHGQVAVQVDKERTAVEAAVNEVEVLVHEEGVERTFTVKRGHYLIIKPGKKAKVIQGMLKMELELPDN